MSDLKVEKNRVVSFVYTIVSDKGEVLEQNDVPSEYIHGLDERVFPQIVTAMEGAVAGAIREVTLPPEEAFGQYDYSKTFRDKLENVPDEYRKLGAEATFQNEKGEQLTMRVVSMENGEIFLDGNHPLAGKTITFRMVVKGVREATDEELESGEVITPAGQVSVH